MDRSKMDRSMINPYRVEEKELCFTLYRKIKFLTLVYRPNEEVNRVLTHEMFLKPNSLAFLHITAYLFRLIDPVEFRKRFYWPITDKRAESNFRSKAVDYFKYLKEKHQLNWSHINSYLVLMPGGMKFINFMLDFCNFVIRECIKQKEKQLSLDADKLRQQFKNKEKNIQIVIKQHNFFKKYASDYLKTINEVNSKTKVKINHLTKQLNVMTSKTNIPMHVFTSDTFIKKFHDDTYALYKKVLNDKCNKLLLVERKLIELKEIMANFNREVLTQKYDNDKILQLSNCFHVPIPQSEEKSGGQINVNNIICIFNHLHDLIQNMLTTSSKLPLIDKNQLTNLTNVKEQLEGMEIELNKLARRVNTNTNVRVNMTPCTPSREHAPANNASLESNLLMKFIATPPIKLEIFENNCQKRLTLMDTESQKTNEILHSFLAPTQTMRSFQTIKEHEKEKSIQKSITSTIRTKVINPFDLLKTIEKQTHKSNMKLKPRGVVFDIDEESKSPKTSHLTPCSLKSLPSLSSDMKIPSQLVSNPQSPFTPLHTNDCTFKTRHLFNTSDSADNASALNPIKKLSAVKKIQYATKDPVNLNISPSGRLTALFADDENNTTHNLPIPTTNLDENNSSAANVSKESNKWKILGENLQNEQNEQELLLNISDSVLNDVII